MSEATRPNTSRPWEMWLRIGLTLSIPITAIIFGALFAFLYFSLNLHKTLVISGATFVASLIIFHTWLYIYGSSHYSADIIRIIDYFYLAVGSLSLLTAVQVDQAINSAWYDPLDKEIRLTDFNVADELTTAIAIKCRPGSTMVLQCERAREEAERLQDMRMTGQFDMLKQEYERDLHDRDLAEVGAPWIPELMSSYLQQVKAKPPEDHFDTWLVNYRGLALALLMEAIALRIARVTVELGKWYVPDRPTFATL